MKYGIVGGGIAGLTAAYRLTQKGHEVALFEARPQLGGQAGTFEVGGNRLEVFYHHLFSGDSDVLGLIDEMGLGDRMSWRESKVGFFHGGRIYNFVTPGDLLRFKPVSLIDRVRLGLDRRLPASTEGLATLRRRHRPGVDQEMGRQAQLRRRLGAAAARQVRLARRRREHGLVLGQDLPPLRLARRRRVAEGAAGLPDGQLRPADRRAGATAQRGGRPRRGRAARASASSSKTGARPASSLPAARPSPATPSSPPCPIRRSWR